MKVAACWSQGLGKGNLDPNIVFIIGVFRVVLCLLPHLRSVCHRGSYSWHKALDNLAPRISWTHELVR